MQSPQQRRRVRVILFSILAFFLGETLTSAQSGAAEWEADRKRSIDSFRPDRASGGFRAFLEIRGAEKRALRIVQIAPNGPAAMAGLRVGDLIVGIEGADLPAWSNDFQRVLAIDSRFSAGNLMALTIERRVGPPEDSRVEKKDVVLNLVTMARADQEELIGWVAQAEKRLRSGDPLYCHDIRPSNSGTHHVCEDQEPATEQPEESP